MRVAAARNIENKILFVYPGRDAVHFIYLWCKSLMDSTIVKE